MEKSCLDIGFRHKAEMCDTQMIGIGMMVIGKMSTVLLYKALSYSKREVVSS